MEHYHELDDDHSFIFPPYNTCSWFWIEKNELVENSRSYGQIR